jgi:hypothetical protein
MTSRRGQPGPAYRGNGRRWDVRFGSRQAETGWADLRNEARGEARKIRNALRRNPYQDGDVRPARLRGPLEYGQLGDKELPRWVITTPCGGRVVYMIDEDVGLVWITFAEPSPGYWQTRGPGQRMGRTGR